jgi:hypothetical protein
MQFCEKETFLLLVSVRSVCCNFYDNAQLLLSLTYSDPVDSCVGQTRMKQPVDLKEIKRKLQSIAAFLKIQIDVIYSFVGRNRDF